MLPIIVMTDTPDSSMRPAVGEPLRRFNEQCVGPADFRALVLLLKHPETDEVIGGLWGGTAYRQLHIDMLVVPEPLRGNGLGRQLMSQAEDEAQHRGCVGAWLDTFTFQARGFYERIGYTAFGRLDDFPPGHSCIFMKKTFCSPSHDSASKNPTA